MELITSFLEKVSIPEDTSACWEWTAGKSPNGYGVFRSRSAHRWFYEHLNGQLPKEIQVDHLCRNRACVNPEHLEPVTRSENLRRVPPKTHCRNGHEFTEENTYLYRDIRYCRTCQRNNDKKRDRYNTNPEYREKLLVRSRERYLRNK